MQKRPTYTVPVRCVETGERWNTKTDAAKAMGVSLSVLCDRIRFREPIDGKHFEHVNPIKIKPSTKQRQKSNGGSTMSKLIYQPKGKAREYSPWACNLFNGCTNNCSYCYNKKGVGSKLLGKEGVTLKSGFNDIEEAYFTFVEELDKYKNAILADGKGLFFNFVSDPFLEETWELNFYCAQYAVRHGVSCVFLSKKRPHSSMIQLFVRHKSMVKVGFTLTGMDELEPNADTNSERIEAIRILSERGVHTWASIEPIINVEKSLYMITRAHNVGCREFRIGVLSGKKEYTPRDVLAFKEAVEECCPDCTILWKNSLLEFIKQPTLF